MTSEDPDSGPGAALGQTWQREQRVELDLTSPPTRAQAGIPEGRNTLALEQDPPGLLDVRLRLPEGHDLRLQAVSMYVEATLTTEPSSIGVSSIRPRDEVLRTAEALVAEYGFDPARLPAFLDAAGQGASTSRPLGTARLGYLSLDVGLREVDSAGDLQLDVNLYWDVPVRPGAVEGTG